ncbi:MAG: porin [Thermoanaerobaculia bacterium]|nr:porin [Thermoanaerobaculia bacterium]
MNGRPLRLVLSIAALLLGSAAAGQQTGTAPASGDPPAPEELALRLETLERALSRAGATPGEATEEAAPTVLAGADGFGWRSADGAFQLRLRGLLQTDGRFVLSDDRRPGTDTLLVRRARPIVEAVFAGDFELRLMPDFGNGKSELLDAHLDWKVTPALRLRAGKFKVPVGLEALLSDAHLPFAERGLPSALAPVRDVGVQASAEPWQGRLVLALGAFNGQADGVTGDSDGDDDKEIAARLVFRPFERPRGEAPAAVSLGLGLAATAGSTTGSTAAPGLPSYRTPGGQSYFSYRADGTAAGTAVADGTRRRLAPQGWLYAGPFGGMVEWTRSEQEVVRGTTRAALVHEGWQVSLTWVLTGERFSERGVTPRRPYAARGSGKGAVSVSLRAGELAIDPDVFPHFADPARSARRATNLDAAANWLLNRNVKLVVDYQHTSFDGGDRLGDAVRDRETERVVLTRFQLSF